MTGRAHSFVFLLIAAVWLATSNLLTLCVHEDHVGVEPSWATCCETASCCEPAPGAHADGAHAHVGGADGCRDYTLTLGEDWAPGDPRSPTHPDLAAVAPAPLSGQLCPAALANAPCEPRGVPPPVRPQRSPVLRC